MSTETSDERNTSRRSFINNGMALSLSHSLKPVNTIPEIQTKEISEPADLSEKVKKLLALFNLKYPIFPAAPGVEKLAITLANAGAMGAISLNMTSPEGAYDMLKRVRAE